MRFALWCSAHLLVALVLPAVVWMMAVSNAELPGSSAALLLGSFVTRFPFVATYPLPVFGVLLATDRALARGWMPVRRLNGMHTQCSSLKPSFRAGVPDMTLDPEYRQFFDDHNNSAAR